MLKRISIFLIVFLLFVSMFFVFLFNGIRIDSFSFFNFNITKLYIKLDKKLIVEIEGITLSTQSEVKTTMEDIKSIVSKVPTVLKYFERIDIESFKIKDNRFKILFDNNFIYLDNKNINIASKYQVEDSIIEFKLYSIYLKKQNAMLRGKVKIDYEQGILNFFGNYDYKKVNGELNIQATKEYLDFFITSNKIKNLKFLKSFFRLPKVGEQWMYDNVKGEMKLNYLYGKLKTTTFEPIMDEIKGDATITNAQITFNKKVAPVKTKELHIVFDKGTLNFHMLKPMYKNIDIDGSFVKIPNLVNKKGRVQIDIKAKHLLDENVLEILRAYKINLPIKQVDGRTEALLFLDVPYNGDIKVKGVFNIKDANLLLNNFSLYTKNAKVTLEDYNVLITSPSVKHKTMIDAKVNLKVDIKNENIKGDVFIKSFLIKDEKSEIINIKDVRSSFLVDFKDNTSISLKELSTKILLQKDFIEVDISNFDSIYKYSKLLKSMNIKKGKLHLKIKDENEIYIDTQLQNLTLPIKKDDKDITSLHLMGSLKNNDLNLTAQNYSLAIRSLNNKVSLALEGIDIFYKKEGGKNASLFNNISFKLINSNIKIDDNDFYSKNSKIFLGKNVVNIDGIFYKKDLPFFINKKRITEYDVKAVYKNNILELETKDKKLKVFLDEENLKLQIKDMDLEYDTSKKEDSSYLIQIEAKNSSIIINNKYKVLADVYTLSSNKKRTSFILEYEDSKVTFLKNDENKIIISASQISDKMVNTFFNKDIVTGGKISVEATSLDNILSGKVVFNNNVINNLAILNNLITLVETTPALINPFLAIPAVFGMVKNGGFNLNGYAINEGHVDFIYNIDNLFLNMHKISTIGNSVDFTGQATIDFKNQLVDGNVNLIFMKTYSQIVKYIPLVNYVFLGDEKVVSTNIEITGDLKDPTITTNLASDSVAAPVNVIKRIFKAPFELFKSDKKKEEKENKVEEKEEVIEKK